MSLAGAILNLQAKAKALTTVSIKSAPDTPIDGTPPLPAVITHISSGSNVFQNVASLEIECVVKTNFYFPRGNLPEACDNLNAVYIEFIKKVATDPTLGNNVTSVRGTTFDTDFQQNWNGQPIAILSISVPLKIRETPA